MVFSWNTEIHYSIQLKFKNIIKSTRKQEMSLWIQSVGHFITSSSHPSTFTRESNHCSFQWETKMWYNYTIQQSLHSSSGAGCVGVMCRMCYNNSSSPFIFSIVYTLKWLKERKGNCLLECSSRAAWKNLCPNIDRISQKRSSPFKAKLQRIED